MDVRQQSSDRERDKLQGSNILFNPQKMKSMGERINSHLRLIRERLLSGGSITPLEALRDFGCYRLASRISDLKKEGLNIKKTMEKSVSRVTGLTVRYARYFLSPKK